jgi:hypothetical protein
MVWRIKKRKRLKDTGKSRQEKGCRNVPDMF